MSPSCFAYQRATSPKNPITPLSCWVFCATVIVFKGSGAVLVVGPLRGRPTHAGAGACEGVRNQGRGSGLCTLGTSSLAQRGAELRSEEVVAGTQWHDMLSEDACEGPVRDDPEDSQPAVVEP